MKTKKSFWEIYEAAAKLTARKPDGSMDEAAPEENIAKLLDLDIIEEKRRRARQIIDIFRGHGTRSSVAARRVR